MHVWWADMKNLIAIRLPVKWRYFLTKILLNNSNLYTNDTISELNRINSFDACHFKHFLTSFVNDLFNYRNAFVVHVFSTCIFYGAHLFLMKTIIATTVKTYLFIESTANIIPLCHSWWMNTFKLQVATLQLLYYSHRCWIKKVIIGPGKIFQKFKSHYANFLLTTCVLIRTAIIFRRQCVQYVAYLGGFEGIWMKQIVSYQDILQLIVEDRVYELLAINYRTGHLFRWHFRPMHIWLTYIENMIVTRKQNQQVSLHARANMSRFITGMALHNKHSKCYRITVAVLNDVVQSRKVHWNPRYPKIWTTVFRYFWQKIWSELAWIKTVVS